MRVRLRLAGDEALALSASSARTSSSVLVSSGSDGVGRLERVVRQPLAEVRTWASRSARADRNAASSPASTARSSPLSRPLSRSACASSTAYCPSPRIRTITAAPPRSLGRLPAAVAGWRVRRRPSIASGALPAPISPLSRASSSSTSPLARHPLQLGGDVVLRGAGRVVERAAGEQLVDGAGPGLHRLGLVLGALDGQADVAHLLGDAGERLADLGLRLGRGVGRLDGLLAGAEGVDLGLQPLRGEGELLLLGLQLRRAGWPGRSAAAARRTGGSAPRGPGPPGRRRAPGGPAPRACRTAACSCWSCSSRRLREVATSATPRRTFCSISSCAGRSSRGSRAGPRPGRAPCSPWR